MTLTDDLMAAIRADPLDEGIRLVLADHLEEQGESMRPMILRSGRIPLEPLERAAITLLAGVVMLPGSFDKKFSRDMNSRMAENTGRYAFLMEKPLDRLTPKQLRCIWMMVARYRRQLPDEVGRLAQDIVRHYAGD